MTGLDQACGSTGGLDAERALVVCDLGVPGDVEPWVATLTGVCM